MRAVVIFFVLSLLSGALSAQYVYTIKADSVKLTNCDSSELIIENHTQGVRGFLFNTGNGRTIFRRGVIKINDSFYLIGADTLKMPSNSWVQGGNRFGATGMLGTLDNNHLDFYTNSVRRARIDSLGNFSINVIDNLAVPNLFALTNSNGSFPWVSFSGDAQHGTFNMRPNNSAFNPVLQITTGYNSSIETFAYSDLSIKAYGGLDLYGGYGGGALKGIRFFPGYGGLRGVWSQAGNLIVGDSVDNGNKLQVKGNTWLASGGKIIWDNREVTVGDNAAGGYEGIAIGYNSAATFAGATAIGKNVVAGATNVIHIGYYPAQLSETTPNTLRIGMNYQNYIRISARSTALGTGASTTTDVEGGTAVGYLATANGKYSIAMGPYSVAENDGDFVAGAGNTINGEKPITNVYFGTGRDRNLAGTNFAGPGIGYTINGSGAYGTDFPGGNITIAGGKGTGAGLPGNIIFSSASSLSSGSTLQSLQECARFAGVSGNLLLGSTTDDGNKLQVNGTIKQAYNNTANFGNGLLFDIAPYNSISTSRILSSGEISYQSNYTGDQHVFENSIGTSFKGTLVTLDPGAYNLLPDSQLTIKVLGRSGNLGLSVNMLGHTGIGTLYPSAQLHTTGTVRFAGLTSDTTQTRVLVSDASGNLYYRDASTLAGSGILNSDLANGRAILPSLAVNGTISAHRMRLSQTGWPDYVFGQGYHLPRLTEIEAYIQEHGHLPGIASAAEVEKKGIDVGDHQAALLKKIEELTLYNIAQEKELQDQHKRLETQATELSALKQEMAELKKMITGGSLK